MRPGRNLTDRRVSSTVMRHGRIDGPPPAMERRKHPRIPQRLYVTIDDLPGQNIAFTSDVSPHGISIESNAPLTPGSYVTIKFPLPSGKILNLVGHVRWASRNTASSKNRFNTYGIGVHLQKAPEEFHRFIKSIANAPGGKELPPAARSAPASTTAGTDDAHPDPQMIIAAYATMKQQNHHDVLGVTREATAAQIKQAYYRLAQRYHPDGSLGTSSPELRRKLEALFDRIAEAYVALSSHAQRPPHDARPGKDGGSRSEQTATKQRRSNQHVEKGVLALKKGQPEMAAACFELAVKARPDKWRYHTLLAYALSKIPNRERDAETHYKKAIELEPSRIENYIALGRLYRKTGRPKQALHTFEDALDWNAESTRVKKEIKALK